MLSMYTKSQLHWQRPVGAVGLTGTRINDRYSGHYSYRLDIMKLRFFIIPWCPSSEHSFSARGQKENLTSTQGIPGHRIREGMSN